MASQMSVWLKEEEEYLITNYRKVDIETMCEDLNRSKSSITNRLHLLRKSQKVGWEKVAWTLDETEYLIKNYGKISSKRIAEELDIAYSRVRSKIVYLKKTGVIGNNIQVSREEQLKKIEEQRENKREKKRREEKRFRESLKKERANRCYGIGKKQLPTKFEKDKQYIIEVYSPGEQKKLKLRRTFKGKLVQATHNHVTFINKNDVRESFLKNDFLLGEIKVKEIA